ncbi:MAG: hypothetical protein KDD34_03730 [Bdellovibrionales bacterium]|nr:hypothetical protein [Bdellovibrionales bacterium]
MSVSSIGPFQVTTQIDLPDIKNVTDLISEKAQGTGEVEAEAATDDSTQDQENRGFIQVIDFIDQLKKKHKGQMRQKRNIMFSRESSLERAIFKYNQLIHIEEDLEDKGRLLNKSV